MTTTCVALFYLRTMPTQQPYHWIRFWLPRNAPLRFDAHGYLADPQEPLGDTYNPELWQIETIADIPCLILLGEPGMGKSTVLRSHGEAIKSTVEAAGDAYLFYNLGMFQTDGLLHQQIFGSQVYQRWLAGSHRLYLLLDSLDECRLNIKTVATLLAEQLQECPTDRLYLRIACRTTQWVSGLEQALRKKWGEAVGVFDLAPLRRVDIASAAIAAECDPQAFLADIERSGVVPLAIKPITLTFLLSSYLQSGRLPVRQASLYEQGCLILCDEHSSSRRDAGYTDAFSAHEKLRTAEQLAYLTIFSNRSTIWAGPANTIRSSEVLEVDSLVYSDHLVPSERVLIKEVLGTGLFTMRTLDQFSWSHQTYAEFLAARSIRDLPLPQIQSLLFHTGDTEPHIVPQLYETAAWLVGMKPEMFQLILAHDPEVLLRSDLANADPQDRAALVAALLARFEREERFDTSRRWNRQYHKLAHPALAEQLRPFICDSQKGLVVRRVAIDIAEDCGEQLLLNDLVDVALNKNDQYDVRVQATWALLRIGDQVSKARLKPLALGQAGDDPNDELRGCALIATWPHHVSAEELFSSLAKPQRENYYGSYQSFLTSHCLQHLQPGDLSYVLAWATNQASIRRPSVIHSFIDRLLKKAWLAIEEPVLLEQFAAVIEPRIRELTPIFQADVLLPIDDASEEDFGARWIGDVNKRRHLFTLLFDRLAHTPHQGAQILFSHPPIVFTTDFAWLIEQLLQESDGKKRIGLANIIARMVQTNNVEHMEQVYQATQLCQEFAASVKHIFGYVRFDSEEANQRKAEYASWKEIGQRIGSRPKPQPPKFTVEEYLQDFEGGDISAWWRLNIALCYDPEKEAYRGELEYNISVMPGWQLADTTTRRRIISAAAIYIGVVQDEPAKWLHEDGYSLYQPSFAGYRAFYLLLREDRQTLLALPSVTWCNWATIIVSYPRINEREEEGSSEDLIGLAYKHCPSGITDALMQEIERDNKRGHTPLLHKLEHCWDERLADALLSWLSSRTVRPTTMGSILGELLKQNISAKAQAFAEHYITQPIPENTEDRSLMLTIARLLVLSAHDARWSSIWPLITQNPEFGRELVLSLAQRPFGIGDVLGSRLSEQQIMELYLWLVEQFPYQDDPKEEGEDGEGFYEVTPRHEVAHWRNNLLHILQQKGTVASVKALQHIQERLPANEWIRWMVFEAQNITRRMTWTPPHPAELLSLNRSREARLVESGAQLLDIIIESLQRLEHSLQGETPAAIDLWNEGPYRPKDENRLSDYVKRHLVRDLCERGVVINREVEIQRGAGENPGERTDIKIDAVRKAGNGQTYDVITVIIETKCCYHRELQTAMQYQLRDRYLREHRSDFGIYLVGWFNCTAWDDEDDRKQQAPKLTAVQAQEFFDHQATTLSQAQSSIRAFVLNTALPDLPKAHPTSRTGRKRRSKTDQADEPMC
jgi:hypothetical protein